MKIRMAHLLSAKFKLDCAALLAPPIPFVAGSAAVGKIAAQHHLHPAKRRVNLLKFAKNQIGQIQLNSR